MFLQFRPVNYNMNFYLAKTFYFVEKCFGGFPSLILSNINMIKYKTKFYKTYKDTASLEKHFTSITRFVFYKMFDIINQY